MTILSKVSVLGDAELQGKVKIFILMLFLFLVHAVLLMIHLLLILLSLLFLLLFSQLLLSSLLQLFSLNYSAPISSNISWYPILYLQSGYSLHTKYFQTNIIFTWVRIRHSFNIYVMTTTCVFDHGVDRGKLFGTFGTMKVLCFLVMMQDDFIFKSLFAVEAEGF